MRFSIIIPTYERPQRLRKCLAGVAALRYDRDQFEVIVVDDGGSQPAASVVSEFEEQINLRCLRQENAGPASARNLGARHASGEILAFLDDDCVPRPDWLEQLGAASRCAPGALLGGATTNGCPENVFAATNQILLDAVVRWFEQQQSTLRFFASNNLAVPAAAFHAIGGFDSRISIAAGEDREFCARWIASGRPLAAATEAHIDHFHPQSLLSFVHMHFRYGRGAALLHQLRQTRPLRRVDRGLYMALLRDGLLRPRRGLRLVIAALVLVSQAAAACGYFTENRPGRGRQKAGPTQVRD